MISDVRTWFLLCDEIEENALVNVNKISADVGNYTVDAITTNPLIFEDIVGNQKKQIFFYFTGTVDCSTMNKEEASQNKFERIIEWIENKNKLLEFPTVEGKEIKLESNVEVYSKTSGGDKAVYQIKVSYLYKGGF